MLFKGITSFKTFDSSIPQCIQSSIPLKKEGSVICAPFSLLQVHGSCLTSNCQPACTGLFSSHAKSPAFCNHLLCHFARQFYLAQITKFWTDRHYQFTTINISSIEYQIYIIKLAQSRLHSYVTLSLCNRILFAVLPILPRCKLPKSKNKDVFCSVQSTWLEQQKKYQVIWSRSLN